MIGYIVEKNLTVAGPVKSHLTKLLPWKHMRGNIVEKNLTTASRVKSHLKHLVTWKIMRGYTVEKNLTAAGHVKIICPSWAWVCSSNCNF